MWAKFADCTDYFEKEMHDSRFPRRFAENFGIGCQLGKADCKHFRKRERQLLPPSLADNIGIECQLGDVDCNPQIGRERWLVFHPPC